MATLPRRCPHCKTSIYHYGVCRCPDATIEWVDAERQAIAERLKHLDAIEREALGLVPERT